MKSSTVRQVEQARLEKEGELAKQVRERSRQKRGVNFVSKEVRPNIDREAESVTTVTKPGARRRYVAPSNLPAMPDLPGYHMEYVRRDERKEGDYANLKKHQRVGWEPVRPSELGLEHLPTTSLAQFGDCIGNEDTVLMKLPLDLWADREEQIAEIRDGRTAAVNGKELSVDQVHGSLPVFTEKNEHSITKPSVTVRAGFR